MNQEPERLDRTIFRAYKMSEAGNIDFEYWFDKTNNEKMKAASGMTSVAFMQPNFITTKVDRIIFKARKHRL